jgi:hypothetical protein
MRMLPVKPLLLWYLQPPNNPPPTSVDDAFLGVGMESGIMMSGDTMFDVCACVLFDGEHTHIG